MLQKLDALQAAVDALGGGGTIFPGDGAGHGPRDLGLVECGDCGVLTGILAPGVATGHDHPLSRPSGDRLRGLEDLVEPAPAAAAYAGGYACAVADLRARGGAIRLGRCGTAQYAWKVVWQRDPWLSALCTRQGWQLGARWSQRGLLRRRSDAIFVTTANQLETIPEPLRDRMEVLQLDGYSSYEKSHIARKCPVPRQIKASGLRDDEVTFIDGALDKIIRDYTRKAGVRTLERPIGAVCRKAAVRIAAGEMTHLEVTPEQVRADLKQELFRTEMSEPFTTPGIATGLAVPPGVGLNDRSLAQAQRAGLRRAV